MGYFIYFPVNVVDVGVKLPGIANKLYNLPFLISENIECEVTKETSSAQARLGS